VKPFDVKGYAALYTVEDSRIVYSDRADSDLATASRAPTRQEPGKLALVIDGDPRRRRPFESVLRKAGFEVLTCEDGADAWKLARARRPSVIVTHFMLSGLSGLEILERARKSKDLRTSRVLVIGDSKTVLGLHGETVVSNPEQLAARLAD
jgi:CheY-like chemotaxis protein